MKTRPSVCRSRALVHFVKEVQQKYKQNGLKPPTSDRIVRYILNKHRIKAEDILKDEIIRF